MVSRAIERAQKQVEGNNFGTRKHLLEYDDVMNKQRENVYGLRRELLDGQIRLGEDDVVDTRGYLLSLAEELVEDLVETHAGKNMDSTEWDLGGLVRASSDLFGLEPEAIEALDLEHTPPDAMADKIYELASSHYNDKEKTLSIDGALLRRIERDIMLQIVDAQWKDHLYSLDHLKEGISLRGYGQRDPLVEYKKESFELFQAMKARIDEEMVRYLWRVRPIVNEGGEPAPPVRPAPRRATPPLTLSSGSSASPRPSSGPPIPARTGGDDAAVTTVRRDEPKIGRNDPCYCGSGKKYKKCHGA
jgi:preprotein translocase subunit SecA